MDKLYMREQLDAELARAGLIAPAVIGSPSMPIRKRHVYRIVVSDLERGHHSGSAGVDRSEESLAIFYDFLGPERNRGIRLAVMDM